MTIAVLKQSRAERSRFISAAAQEGDRGGRPEGGAS
jgi:hypothetical protein